MERPFTMLYLSCFKYESLSALSVFFNCYKQLKGIPGLIGVGLMLILPNIIQGQVYNFTTHTPSDGLIQSQVRAILQDHQRFLWLGTHGGISKYDGKQFFSITPEDGLISEFVTCLYQDQNKDVWIGTEQGISRFDGKTFINYTQSSGLSDDYINTIYEDDAGRIWLGTRTGISVMYGGEWRSDYLNWEGFDVMPAVNALVEGKDGELFVGTSSGLYIVKGDHLRPVLFDGEFKKVNILSMYMTAEEEMWIGTDQGLWRWDQRKLEVFNRESGHLPHNTVFCLEKDIDGQLWIGTGNGVTRYDNESFVTMTGETNTRRYIIRSIASDIEGNIWLGTDGGGLQKVIQGVFRSLDMSDGMKSDIAKSFIEDEKGRIWISTYDQGIDVYEDGFFTTHFGQEDGLGGNDISYSIKDRMGNFWFATYSEGVTKYDGNRFEILNMGSGLLSNQVFCLAEIQDKEIWMGTDQGICVWKKGRVVRMYRKEDGLPDNTVYHINRDRLGNIWIATSKGVCRLRKDEIVSYADGGIPHEVFSSLEDKWGRIWFATSNGLFFYDQGEFILVPISGAPGAHNVVSLVTEADSMLWIGTENGAYRLNLANFRPDRRFQYEHYTQKDGLPSMECNANAAFYDSQGNIWIGTVEGAIIHPEGAFRDIEDIPPIVHVTTVRLGLEETDWSKLGYTIQRFSSTPEDLELSHSNNRLAFDYIGISLKSPRQIEYKFKLDGLDKDWSPSTRQTSASYSNLASGTYTFMVVAKSESEKWEYNAPASYTFTIKPAYYETLWFWCIVSLGLGLLGWFVYRYWASERRRNEEEERIKNQAEKLQLEHQALYAMMNPHFTFNALQSIQYFIHRQDRIAANKFLSSFAKLIRKNLESTKSEFISLQEEVDRLRLYLSLEQMRFPEKFTYEVKVDPNLDSQAVLIPPMILQPFVENSIKHGIMSLDEDGCILINIYKQNETYMSVEVIDNGIGVEASQRRRANRPSGHVSKGMQITKDRLALFSRMTGKSHQLTISEIGDNGAIEGTRVTIVLPIHRLEKAPETVGV